MDYCFLAAREAETHKGMVSCPAHTCVRCPVSPAPGEPGSPPAWCRCLVSFLDAQTPSPPLPAGREIGA